jgi:rare lipoprotein A
MGSMAQITEIGLASFYADKFDGRVTASGDIFDQQKMTAAHRTFPFGTEVRVTNMQNKKTVNVIINDRGPFVKDRVIDLSKSAAKKIDILGSGVTQVKVEVISLGKNDKSPVVSANTSDKKPENLAFTKPEPDGYVGDTKPAVSSSNSSIEYFKIDVGQISPIGFGIQIASYQEGANLIRQISDIKASVNRDVLIQVSDKDGNKIYRVIVGPFTSRDDAADFNEKLGNKFKGSFVFTF